MSRLNSDGLAVTCNHKKYDIVAAVWNDSVQVAPSWDGRRKMLRCWEKDRGSANYPCPARYWARSL